MNVVYFLLEANAYLLVFYAFYRVVLKAETFYTLNRMYFLVMPLVAFVLPCFRLSGLHPESTVPATVPELIGGAASADPFDGVLTVSAMAYGAMTILLSVRLLYRLYTIGRMIRKGSRRPENGIVVVNVPGSRQSFSFLRYLFTDPRLAESDTIIRHERVHIRQLHTFDVLFYELVQIVNWFNPVVVLMQRDLKAIHEFIADELTSVEEEDAGEYALFLISNSFGEQALNLVHPIFSQSLLKERIMKLKQQKSPHRAKWKYAVLLFLVPLMVVTTASTFKKSYGLVDLLPANRTFGTTTEPLYLTFVNGARFTQSPDSGYKVAGSWKTLNPEQALRTYGVTGKRGIIDVQGRMIAYGKLLKRLPDSLNYLAPQQPEPPKPKRNGSSTSKQLPPPPPEPPKAKTRSSSAAEELPPPPPTEPPKPKRTGSSVSKQVPPPPEPPKPKKRSSSSAEELPPPPPPEPPRPKVSKLRFPPPVVKGQEDPIVTEERISPPVFNKKAGNKPTNAAPRPKVSKVKFPPPVVSPAKKVVKPEASTEKSSPQPDAL